MLNAAFTPKKKGLEVMVIGSGWNSRYFTLKSAAMFGELEGDDFDFAPSRFMEYFRNKLDFMEFRGAVTRPVESLNCIIDASNGIVTIYFELDGVTYYITGRGLEYIDEEEK